MASLVLLFNEWEIQLLVLLSYMLQAFLFFAGILRRRSCNRFFSLLVWTAYLGADMVASYALGLISRHEDYATSGRVGTHQLIFLWAPFLLIHLGGQDTITAFALEDNNLWLRHLLNLAIQVSLAIYLFWKSSSDTNTQLVVLSILLFVTGTIKYGERTWALWSGVLKNLAEYPLPHYAKQLRNTIIVSQLLDRDDHVHQLLEQIDKDDSSSVVGILSVALGSIDSALNFFWHNDSCKPMIYMWFHDRCPLLPKLLEILEIELGLAYDYVYTKAVVFQTRVGIILRCVSQTSFLAALLLFFVTNKHRYNSIDIAVTYALFVGGFTLEICAVLTTVRSPWTWAWLETRHFRFLASLIMRWQRNRVLWSNSMGQYNMHNYLGQYEQQQSSSLKQGVMDTVRKVVDATCGVEQKFWVSKLLDIKFVKVDNEIMRCIFDKVVEYSSTVKDSSNGPSLSQPWLNLTGLLQQVLPSPDGTLYWQAIGALHTYTELQLRMYCPGPDELHGESTRVLVRKISNYVLYLMATDPGMMPVSKEAEDKSVGIVNYFAQASKKIDTNTNRDDAFLSIATKMLTRVGLPVPSSCTTEQLLETKEAWIRLLVYIAGRSRPEFHAAHLARGGELLTFVWLFMARKNLGDAVLSRIGVTDEHVSRKRTLVLFRFPPGPAHGGEGPPSESYRMRWLRALGEP